MKQLHRPRRNRKNEAIRELTAETHLTIGQLIYPVFICEGSGVESPIKTLSGQSRWSPDLLSKKVTEWKKLGITHYSLFPQIAENKKNSHGTEALNNKGLLAETIKRLKDDHDEINLVTDVALDPFSSDGHDGIVKNGKILNDETVQILAEMAVKQAEWGADWVAPSDMMDGRIGAIRKALDHHGYSETNILAYSAKYASGFYGPFREALQSAPKHGDKKTYQMDPRNSREAVREVKLDMAEGADMVMVKPALAYLDIIAKIKQISSVPVAAYNVSGEYAMIKAAAQAGALDENKVIMETMYAFRRAGADVILTYFAPQVAKLLKA
ncbi:MAG: porphobilinogen synthase [Pseudobdellovibrio sp.]